jgi:flagellar assembly factor FliW
MPENLQPSPLKVNTSRFGEISVSAEQVITLPHGMVGFPDYRLFVLVQHRPDSPFHWLQSLDQPDLAFVVANPLIFDLKYQVSLSNSDTGLLKVNDPKDLQIWAVITIPHGRPDKMTANLKAPVVINLANRLGAQIILEKPEYSVRHFLPK